MSAATRAPPVGASTTSTIAAAPATHAACACSKPRRRGIISSLTKRCASISSEAIPSPRKGDPILLCVLTHRRLKPGTYDAFRDAWQPDDWWPAFKHGYHLRSLDDADEVVSFAFYDATEEE